MVLTKRFMKESLERMEKVFVVTSWTEVFLEGLTIDHLSGM